MRWESMANVWVVGSTWLFGVAFRKKEEEQNVAKHQGKRTNMDLFKNKQGFRRLNQRYREICQCCLKWAIEASICLSPLEQITYFQL